MVVGRTQQNLKSVSALIRELARDSQKLGRALSSDMLPAEVASQRLSKALKAVGLETRNLVRFQKDAGTGFVRMKFVSDDATKSITLLQDRMGKLTRITPKNLQTVGQQVAKNTGEFLKWSAAIALVYEPLRLLNTQVKATIDAQEDLADIAIVLQDNYRRIGDVYDSAARAGDLVAVATEEVLKGYALAIRATGEMESETLRLAKAQEILTTSLVISKLATIDQSKAMDLLVAVMSKVGGDITAVNDLLDKFVAITKVANVDLETLITSYAKVGDVAAGAGIQVGGMNDELAGLVAVLAEATPFSAEETANALRTVISGFSTQGAIKELKALGIATVDMEGNFRGFLELSEEISVLYKQGLISEAQLLKIARALGGGTRGQGNALAILKGLSRAQEINASSADSQGAAYDALAIRTETLNSSLTKLKNAISGVVETMLDDGGLIDTFTSVLDVITSVIKGIDLLVSTLGKSSVVLAGAGIGKLLLGAKNTSTTNILGGFLGGVDTRLNRGRGGGVNQDIAAGTLFPTGQSRQSNLARFAPGGAQLGLGLLGVGIPAAQNFATGETEEGIANIAGGLAGGFIAVLTGNPQLVGIGATVGSAAAEGFLNGITKVEGDLRDIFTEQAILAAGGDIAGGGDVPLSALSQDELNSAALEAIGAGLGLQSEFFREQIAGGLQKALVAVNTLQQETGTQGQFFGGFTGDTAGRDILDQLTQMFAPEFRARVEESVAPDVVSAGREVETQSLVASFGGFVGNLQTQLLSEVSSALISGDISGRESVAQKGNIAGLGASLEGFLQTQGVTTGQEDIEFRGVTRELESVMEEVARVFISASDEERDVINQITASFKDFDSRIVAAQSSGETQITLMNGQNIALAEAIVLRKKLSEEEAAFIGQLSLRQRQAAFQAPNIISVGEDTRFNDPAAFISLIQAIQDGFDKATFGEQTDLRDAFREERQQIILRGGIDEFQALGPGIESRSISEALRLGREQGLVTGGGGKEEQVGLTNIGATFAEFQALLPAYQQLAGQLETAGLTLNEQTTLGVFEDSIIAPISADMSIIQLLLGAIEKNTEDMVDGIFNLPTDGSFFVPLTAAQFTANNSGGGGSLNLEKLFEVIGSISGAGGGGGGVESLGGIGLQEAQVASAVPAETMFRGMATAAGAAGVQATRLEGISDRKLPELGESGKTVNSAKMLQDVIGSLESKLEVRPVTINLRINASFTTELEGAVVANIVNKNLATSMSQAAGVQGISISQAI